MNQPQIVSEKTFGSMLGARLCPHTDRAVTVLRNFGPRLSYDVTNMMLHALDKDKVEDVLSILEVHWREHLQYQHPDIRGTIESIPGVNLTRQMFLRICEKVLALSAVPVAA